MARVDRRAHYVGTWREDHVTDATMRQIIARSHAEKGQKVKVRLSPEGLHVQRSSLFQESFLYAFSLAEVYFLTVNPHHPTCLLCIVADPVRKYLILVLRTASSAESSEMIETFQRLKSLPAAPGSSNVMLRRKDNGNWTLRERSQHNANLHMQQIFKEASSNNTPNTTTTATTTSASSSSSFDPPATAAVSPRQPNGHVTEEPQSPPLSPFFSEDFVDAGGRSRSGRARAHSASQTAGGGGGGGGLGAEDGEEMMQMRMEVETLTQELRDLKMVLEQVGTITPRTPNDVAHSSRGGSTTIVNTHNGTGKSNHTAAATTTTTAVRKTHGNPNGPVVKIHSEGTHRSARMPGEVRVFVEDHRDDPRSPNDSTVTRKPLFSRVQRQITVPEPKNPPPRPSSAGAPVAYHTIHREVHREPAVSASHGAVHHTLVRKKYGGGLRIVAAAPPRRARDPHFFHSMRVSRGSGKAPSTIFRPIEQIYAHGRGRGGGNSGGGAYHTIRRQPVTLVQTHVPYEDVYVSQPSSPSGDVFLVGPEPVPGQRRALTPTHSLRRSAPALGGEAARAGHYKGELDDVLL